MTARPVLIPDIRTGLLFSAMSVSAGFWTNRKRKRNKKEVLRMALNQKAIKVLGKVFEAGFTDEKSIAAMTMDDILAIQGVTIADIGIINELQKSIKANKVISFFGGNAE
jgi:hypothetical protein